MNFLDTIESRSTSQIYKTRIVSPSEPEYDDLIRFRQNGYDNRHTIGALLNRICKNDSFTDQSISPEEVINNPVLLDGLRSSNKLNVDFFVRIVKENGVDAIRNIIQHDEFEEKSDTIAVYQYDEETLQKERLVGTVRAVFAGRESELFQRISFTPEESQVIQGYEQIMELTRLTVDTDGSQRTEAPFVTESLFRFAVSRFRSRLERSDFTLKDGLIAAIMPDTVSRFVRNAKIDVSPLGGQPNWDDQTTRQIAAEFPGYWLAQKPTVYMFHPPLDLTS